MRLLLLLLQQLLHSYLSNWRMHAHTARPADAAGG